MSALRLSRIRVRHTPGIQDGFVVDGFSDGVNIIHGPNGSGKTSLTRAIEAALWCPRDVDRGISIVADYSLLGTSYRVDLEAGHVGVTRDGQQGSAPSLPMPELCKRYQLSLHDLLRASDSGSDFAREIAKQSVGGYDFEQAAKQLGFTGKPSSGGAELKRLEEARALLRKAQQQQAAIYDSAQELAALEARRDLAADSQRHAKVIDLALRYAEARDAASVADRELESFPAVLARLSGDEAERVTRLLARAREQSQLSSSHNDAAQHAAHEALCIFPAGAPPEASMESIRVQCEESTRLSHRIESLEQRRRAAEETVSEHRAAIGAAVTGEQLARVDGVTIGELAELAVQGEQIAAEVREADAEIAHTASAADADAAPLGDGLFVLASWLQAPRPGREANTSRHYIVLLSVLGVAGWLWIAVGIHPAAVIGALAVLVLAYMLVRPMRSEDEQSTWERKYAALRLPQPPAWEVSSVVQLWGELGRRAAERDAAMHLATRQAEAKRKRAIIEEARLVFQARCNAAATRFGVAPGMDARQLSFLCDRIGRWRDAVADHRAAVAELAVVREHLDHAMLIINSLLSPYGLQPARTSFEAIVLLRGFEDRLSTYRELVRQRDLDMGRGDEANKQLTETRKEAAVLLERAEIDDTTDPDASLSQVQDLCALRQAYVEVADRRRSVHHALDSLRRSMETTTGFDATLCERPVSELVLELARSNEQAAEFGALVDSAAALRTRVEAAKHGSDVEEALSAVSQAEEDLRALQARDLSALVGNALLEHIRRQTVDAHRPEVFRRARDLFATFTHGCYHLEFEDGENGAAPCFWARDVRDEQRRTLDQLSSATRVQLLLAVRIAFVETQEQGVKLPLLLDETLGTSDDRRAQAIIDAVSTLAEQGRQVFYFTAQHAEVAKWKSALGARSVDWGVTDLALARRLSDRPGHVPIEDVLAPMAEVPPADGLSHAAYGAILGFPPIRPGASTASSAHLWYVIDDVPTLAHLLGVVGRDATWGQLEMLVERGGLGFVHGYELHYSRARALARAIAAMHREAAIGRGRPVDRRALSSSGAVSAAKLNEVVQVAERFGGDAVSLLGALENGEVDHFRTKKVAELRDYLKQTGFLVEEAPRAPSEIRLAMLGAVEEEILAGRLAIADVDRLIQRIRQAGAHTQGETDAGSAIVSPPLPALALAPTLPSLPQ